VSSILRNVSVAVAISFSRGTLAWPADAKRCAQFRPVWILCDDEPIYLMALNEERYALYGCCQCDAMRDDREAFV
jgi:hypothetical protein